MSAPSPFAPRSSAELAFCREIGQLAKRGKIPLRRAVELFGHMTSLMVEYDKDKRGAAPDQAALGYIEAFLAGLGAGHAEVKLETPEARRLND